MSVHKLKHGIGWFLVIFITTGLTVSTFHSHHTMKWYQDRAESVADIGTVISGDASHCPICGYFFQRDMPSAPSSVVILTPSGVSILADEFDPTFVFEVVQKGRSPPVIG